MKILHCVYLSKFEPGIHNQMQWEQQAATDRGYDWDVRMFCAEQPATTSNILVHPENRHSQSGIGFLSRLGNWYAPRREYYRWLTQQLPNYDVIVLRHVICDPMQALFLLVKQGKFYSVHHSLEVPELQVQTGLKGHLKASLEKIFGWASLQRVAGVIAVTDEIAQYEKKRASRSMASYVYSNGVLYENDPDELTNTDTRDSTIPELFFVAGHFAAWHGLDLLLDSIEKSSANFVLHLVGKLNPADEKRAQADPRIKLHGYLDRNQLKALYQPCWVGLSSFALFRINMNEGCTLKVREYLMSGLPVYAGSRDVFPDSFPYFRHGKADIAAILDFAREMRGTTKGQVSQHARRHIDKSELLAGLHQWLLEQSPKQAVV